MCVSLSDVCKTLFQTTFPYICFSFMYIAQVNSVSMEMACITILHTYGQETFNWDVNVY